MGETITVGIDGSPPSHYALKWSMRRAAATKSGVLLVAVLRDESGPEDPDAQDSERREIARTLSSEADYGRTIAPDVPVTSQMRHGRAMRELLAASAQSSLVVVGTHKTGFIRGRVFGSRSLTLAASSPIPVAVIPESSGRSRRGVVVGVDSSLAGRAAIRWGAREAARINEPLNLISAWPVAHAEREENAREVNNERAESRLRSALADAVALVRAEFPTVEVHPRIIRRRAAEALVDASAASALTVLGNSARRGDDEHWLGSVAHDVLLNLAGPTVIVHSNERESA